MGKLFDNYNHTEINGIPNKPNNFRRSITTDREGSDEA